MPPKSKVPPHHAAALEELRAFGLAYPEAHYKSPSPDHMDLAVCDETFAYMSVEGEPFGLSCKLPESAAVALELPFTEPTGYGLGKSGWVSARFNSATEEVTNRHLFADLGESSAACARCSGFVGGFSHAGAEWCMIDRSIFLSGRRSS